MPEHIPSPGGPMTETSDSLTPWTLSTLRELVRETQELPGDVLLVIANDPSGNHHLPVSDCCTGLYAREYLYPTEEQRREEAGGDEVVLGLLRAAPLDARPALCLFPMHDQ
ncbi:hypothetical protein [Streptomyces sp. NRRL B-24484]|uniref:hypothetical protein n=1 Tax=Streptomyces sp. NRRL B-24484 TaxID=1463833 RepID=UPI0004C05FDA|nr:hypothetical protein [Streptomyces sp. NRRL B-24484]